VPDEEKSAAGFFFDRGFGTKNTPRADFDEVWRGETHFNNTFLKSREKSCKTRVEVYTVSSK
jgi:hypothetical protein